MARMRCWQMRHASKDPFAVSDLIGSPRRPPPIWLKIVLGAAVTSRSSGRSSCRRRTGLLVRAVQSPANWLKSTGRRAPGTAQGLATETEPPQVSTLPVAQTRWHRTAGLGAGCRRALRRRRALWLVVSHGIGHCMQASGSGSFTGRTPSRRPPLSARFTARPLPQPVG
jgi:hypothetical protein